MEYREKLLKVLIPMQMEIDGTNDIDKTNETEEQNMNKFEAERRFAQRLSLIHILRTSYGEGFKGSGSSSCRESCFTGVPRF